MKRTCPTGKLFAGMALAAIAWSAAASAQYETQPAPPPPPAPTTYNDPYARPVVAERTTYSAPNGPLLGAGLILFGGAYVPSVIVAAEANTSYDNRLYIPVAGPWLDIGKRHCGGDLEPTCSSEWGRRAVLIADGAAQGAGAVLMVAGLLVPGRHRELITAKSDRSKKVQVDIVPQVGNGQYGLGALGSF
jgi:hypothetical protein